MARQANASRTSFAAASVEWLRGMLRKGLAGMMRPRGESRMKLIETLPLGGRRQLMLVVCDGQRVLVGAGGDGVHSIAEMRDRGAIDLAASTISERLPEPVAGAAGRYRKLEVRCS